LLSSACSIGQQDGIRLLCIVPDPNDVTIEDCAADIRDWIAVLHDQVGARCVWVLGHGGGGLVALVAAPHEPNVCGLVLVATPGRPLGEVIRN